MSITKPVHLKRKVKSKYVMRRNGKLLPPQFLDQKDFDRSSNIKKAKLRKKLE